MGTAVLTPWARLPVPNYQTEYLPDPMEPLTYKAVYANLGRELANEAFDDDIGKMTAAEYMVHQDLANLKVRWTDRYREDFKRFLDNMHPIIAVFRSHRLHTISPYERVWVFIVEVFWVLLIALAISFAGHCGEGRCETVGTAGVGAGHLCVFPFTHGNVTYHSCTAELYHSQWCSTKTDRMGHHIEGHWGHCWCQHGSSAEECHRFDPNRHVACVGSECGAENQRRAHAILCCFAHRTGVEWFLRNIHIGDWSLGGALYSGLMNLLFSLCSFQLMSCSCMQIETSALTRRTSNMVGHIVYAFITLIILLPQPFLIYVSVNRGEFHVVLGNFFGGKLIGAVLNVFWQALVFHILWHMQRPPTDEKDKSYYEAFTHGSFHVTAADYESFLQDRLKGVDTLPVTQFVNL